MLKRLIFDVDNVLIPWKEEYSKAIDKALDKLEIVKDNLDGEIIQKAQLEWESTITKYDKKDMLNYFNKRLNTNLTMKFVDLWQENLADCVSKDFSKSYYETFEYLSSKYELVALTNWFTDTQSERMKTAKIYKYFKAVYGGEFACKPNKESFIHAMGIYKPEECVMIGDNLKIDILGAKETGIKNLVWKDIHNQKEKYVSLLDGVIVIKEIEELKNIF